MRSGNRFFPILIFSSVVSLLVLQYFWLWQVYADVDENFRRETTFLFRSALFDMHDSLLQKSVEPVDGDSVSSNWKRYQFHLRNFGRIPPPFLESDMNIMDEGERELRVQVYMDSSRIDDTLRPLPLPFLSKMMNNYTSGNFIIHLRQDSLNVDSISGQFKKVLLKTGIDLPFSVTLLRPDKKLTPPKMVASSALVRLTPFLYYSLSFTGVREWVLNKIKPQIIFSLFITLLTIVSFYLLYRNLRLQQKLVEIKNDFISNVTHELKTPVATVSVALEALKNFDVLENPRLANEYLDIAWSEVNRLALLTDKILKTAIFESNGIKLHREHIHMDKLIDQILSSMRLMLEKSNASVAFDKQGEDFVLTGAVDHLANVIYNLLDNALKYKGGDPVISISLKEMPDTVILSIQDNGTGIPAEYKSRIFEKFFRVPTGDVHTVKGYGLGLNYVSNVVKGHGGTITVDSEMQHGSCFTIVLPRHHEEN